jgi:type I restriction enzyme, R subunit
MNLSEALTRIRLIDPQLRQADWRLDDKTQVRREIPVDGYDAEPWNGVTDYCLYEPAGEVLAVVEAKRCSRNPREADEQLRHYVTEIAKRQSFAPFGFMTNGHATHFWEVGLANPRLVAGCFTPEDLQRLLFIRQHGQPLASTPINTTIVERPYQHEAIRRVAEAFAVNKRRALLVMATGTGKTRTTMALIDLFCAPTRPRRCCSWPIVTLWWTRLSPTGSRLICRTSRATASTPTEWTRPSGFSSPPNRH